MTHTLFESQGYCVEPLFDPALVRAARADISGHLDRVSQALYLPFAQSHPEASLETRIDRIWQEDRSLANLLRIAICTDAHRGPRLQELATSPALHRTAQSLAGRLLDGQVVRIRAGIAAFPEHLHAWHSDVARDDGTACGRVSITAWIPLDDAGPDTGGLELIAGRRATPLPHREDRAFTIAEEALAGQVPVRPTCPAGSVLFLDRFTPHRSLPVTGTARFALVIWMKAASG